MTVAPADKEQAADIARLIMLAMNHDCCRWFAAPCHDLDDFYQMMVLLVRADDSQYSYRNCLVALAPHNGAPVMTEPRMPSRRVMGVLVSYDGTDLHRLRRAFVNAARTYLEKDFSHISDETQPGELYLDSLAVFPQYRHRGVATALLSAGIEKARRLNIPHVGLLVDKRNLTAEHLYRSLGFHYVNDADWGGYTMRHLQYDCAP